MKITCNQFEGLLSFYLNDNLGDNLKNMVEEHLKNCPHCKMKYDVLHTIIDDIKDAYEQFINGDDYIVKNNEKEEEEDSHPMSELSAYIDNELSDEHSVKLRKKIVSKPKLRQKIDKLYKIRQFMSTSFREQKNKLKTDYSKNIIRNLNTNFKTRQSYYHCIGFILFVFGMVCLSILIILHII